MKRFEVVKNYLFNRGNGWNGWGELDEIETFKMETDEEAINYFEKKYGTIVDIDNKDFYSNYKNTISVYELQTVVSHEEEYDDISTIATTVIE